MSTRLVHRAALVGSIFWLALPQTASAARVLFVSDDGSDLAIVDVLRGDGHDVTSVAHDFAAGMNPSLRPDLSSYDCVVWSASTDDSGPHHVDSAAFSNLLDFATNGGNVFVTGYGAIGFLDVQLVEFLGGADGRSFTGRPGPIADLDSDLTTGVVDIRGVTPSSFGRSAYESLVGLGPDTTLIVPSMNDPAAAQWSIRTVGAGHIAWVSGIEDQNVEWTPTDTGPGGAFNAAVRNFVTASTGTGSAPGAPRIGFSTPFSALEGAALMVTARVSDAEGDSVTFSWDLDADGHFGEQPGAVTVTIPEGTTDGPAPFVVSVEASDGLHTSHRSRSIAITNVAPTITSHPPLTAAIAQHIHYALGVEDPAGARDPLRLTLRTGPSSAIVTPDGVFDWTPNESEVTAAGTTRAVMIDVDDGDGGLATQSWQMTVLADHAPSDPTMLYPPMDAPILTRGAHFAIGNSSDLDGDAITYTFELASNAAFDVDAQSSGPLPGTPTGITTWAPDESLLHVGHWFWRVTASDGRATTFPTSVGFSFVPDPSTFPDGGGDASPDGGGMDGSHGCAIGPRRRSSVWPGTISALIALAVVLVRRRR
jgi:hypothetical protein